MKKIFILIVLSTTIYTTVAHRPPVQNANSIDEIFRMHLEKFQLALSDLKQSLDETSVNEKSLKKSFLDVRLAYTQLSLIANYLNPYESILLNRPALQKVEDDNPSVIIPPQGLQQIEALIWQNNFSDSIKQQIKAELEFADQVVNDLREEQDRINKFTDEQVWQAMRNALIILQTKTITSFDTPLSLNGIQESKAILQSLMQYLSVYSAELNKKKAGLFNLISSQIVSGIEFLNAEPSFNSFNRMVFLKEKINPLSSLLTEAAIVLNVNETTGRTPVNHAAPFLFAPNFFDLDFFSPNSRYAFTRERKLLGKALFFDTRLSANGNRSCASCHKPEMAFTDGLKQALNVDEHSILQRNTPGLLNAVYQTKQFYDSRQTMLEFQVSNVVHNQSEMGGSIDALVSILQQDEDMANRFAIAYPTDEAPVNVYTVANAIASYMRSLQSLNSKFDQYMRNEPGIELSNAEKNGFNLFMGKAKCGTCHFMPLFNGLVPPGFSETESEVIGVPESLQKPFRLDTDSGKYNFTNSPVHLFAFKTPSLRNITLTAPYMHNGVYQTLEQVINFYNDGGGKGLGIAPPNQSLPFDKLQLTRKEKKDIIHFLQTLTDTSSYQQ